MMVNQMVQTLLAQAGQHTDQQFVMSVLRLQGTYMPSNESCQVWNLKPAIALQAIGLHALCSKVAMIPPVLDI